MTQMLEALVQRRSVRTFADKPVGEEMVQLLLRAAQCAPSAGNEKPWHFVVLQDRNVITRIPEFHPYSAVLLKCSLAIALFADLREERFPGNWPLDCAAATQNILLQAQALHLGAVWLGIYPEKERMKCLEELLEVPEDLKAFSVVAVGHPAEKPPIRRNPSMFPEFITITGNPESSGVSGMPEKGAMSNYETLKFFGGRADHA